MPSPTLRRHANWCALLPLAILLGSCQTTGSSGKTESVRVACAAFAPVYWSARDTGETVAQVKEHNAAWKVLCQSSGSKKQ